LFAALIERGRYSVTRPYMQLYDLKNDSYEINNICGNKNLKKIKKELTSELMK